LTGRPRVRLTRAGLFWALTAVGLGGVGWYKTINLLLLAGYFLLALLLVNLRLAWRASSQLRATRRPTPPAFAGETVTVTADVTNESAFPVTTLVTATSGDHRAAWLLSPLEGGDRKPIEDRRNFPSRGRHAFGPLVVDSSYPLGLLQVGRQVASDDSVLVLPAPGTIDAELFRYWLARQEAGVGETRRPSRRATPGNGDVRGLRPYRAGDSPREVHWRTSARLNRLVVREYDCVEPMDLVLVIDPWLPPDVTAEATRRLEWVLSLAASLGVAAARGDEPSELTLILPGPPPAAFRGPATTDFVRRAFAELAEVMGRPDVPAVPAEFVRPRANRAARLVLSPRRGSPTTLGLRAAGVRCAEVTPERPPAWFVPPAALARPAG
jgi:uncharacterized protein (DUF58 family)